LNRFIDALEKLLGVALIAAVVFNFVNVVGRYILGQIAKGQLKIQPTSQERLEAVRPRMVSLFEDRAGS